MANRTRDIIVRFLGDDRDLKKATDSVNQNVGGVGKGFKAAGTLIQTAFAAVVASSLARVAGELVTLGQKAEAIRRRFNIVFGEMAKDVEGWADSVNESFGLGQVAVQNMAAQVQDLLVPLGFVRSEAAGVTQEVLTSAAALSQWTGGAVSVEDAAERIRKAMLGEREGLEALGIKILESTVQQRLLEKGQNRLIGNELERAKVLATLELIQEKSTDAMSAFAEQTDKAAVAQRELVATYEDARQELGDKAYDAWATSIINVRDATHGANKELGLSFLGIVQFIPGVRGMIRAWDDSVVAQEAAREMSEAYHESLDAGHHRRRTVVDDTEDYAEAARDAQTALALLHTEQEKDLDPVLKLIKNYDRLTEAQDELATLQAEGTATSTELRDAQLEVIEAQLNLNGATDAFRTTGDNWKDSFAEVAAQVGFTADEIARMIGLIGEANGTTITMGVGRQAGPTGEFQFAQGGVVPGTTGAPHLAIVHGGETVIPAGRGGMGGGVGFTTIINNNHFTVNDTADAQRRIVQLSQRDVARLQRETV